MDLTTAASMPVLDTDLERLLQEQRRKLSALGIFPPARHTSEAHSAGRETVGQSTHQPSTITTSKKVDPAGLFPSSSDGRRSAGDAVTGRLDRLAQTEERIARLLGVEGGDGGAGSTSSQLDYQALLRPAMADMPHTAADLLNRIRQKSMGQNAVSDSVKQSQFNIVHANTQLSRRKTVVESGWKKSASVTKSESQLNTKKAAGKIRDRLRTLKSEVSANLITAGKSCEDALSYVDITAKTLGQEATLQMMKGKLTAKEGELSSICQTASKNQQLAQKKAAEVRQMEEEHRQLKAKQMEQEKKLRACRKQLEEARRTCEVLTAEVERLSAELKGRRKGQVDVAKKRAMPQISAARWAAANDKALKELLTLKEQNKALRDSGQKLQKDVKNQGKRHEGNLTNFLTVVKKQQALMTCRARQRHLCGQMQLLKTADEQFRQLLDVTSITS
ncbi:hypothetical protein RvY_00010 [Ramazzottius varieornatus]|uniref:Uncharacterized protein n=1 Tax=Ramazzottius varieornatus TaxID=947166 RepID=A0A1D1UL83_RAMVA|nr:hypothetical protein RvY_00010 [Ramazzottius varieornatus]